MCLPPERCSSPIASCARSVSRVSVHISALATSRAMLTLRSPSAWRSQSSRRPYSCIRWAARAASSAASAAFSGDAWASRAARSTRA